MSSLSHRLIVPLLAFVVAGSLALVMWLQREERKESHQLFAAIARTNADFIRTQKLPRSDRMAQALSEMLDMQVQFFRPQEKPRWIPGDRFVLGFKLSQHDGTDYEPDVRQGVQAIDGNYEMAAEEVHPGEWLVLLRQMPHAHRMPWRALPALLIFWVLSLGLAWTLARGIVRPLRTFAERLPQIADLSVKADLPEATRPDEIGQLARAYRETREQLITERQAREQSERLATLGRMATGMAHEINNPIAAIKLHAQLLQEECDREHQERIEIVLSECTRIEGLVSQWMFLARPQPPHTSACNLGELIGAAVDTLEPTARHADARLVNRVSPAHFVQADLRRLRQAVNNVMLNAIHAMAGQGGTLEIVSAPDERGERMLLHFRDSGPGFSEDALKHATELFFSEKEGGMGIGLSVTAEILRAHGGDLYIANNPAGGATVTFALPSAASSA